MLKERVDLKRARRRQTFNLNGSFVSLGCFNRIVSDYEQVRLDVSTGTASRMASSVAAVENAVEQGEVIYGVTTGFGGMANEQISCEQATALQGNLLNFLAAGAGPELDPRHVRGAMALRANVLLQGCSGIRLEIVKRLIKFLNAGATPVVREYGSIGASGDLVPLACIARAITGQNDFSRIRIDGELRTSQEVLNQFKLSPIELQAKGGLALVNGTSFSAAIAANAACEARNLLAISFSVQSMLMRSLLVDTGPFDAFVHRCKPHPGQIWSATTIRELLTNQCESKVAETDTVQDRYSLRCFPQYTGPIVEGIARVQSVVEREMNAVSDNPLIDPATGQFHQSGNFLGQYVGIAMDDLRRFIGLLAKHIDVQIATVVSPQFNGGLSASLRGNDDKPYNMGLKGLQICGNSIMPMLTYQANPIVEHFPTHAEQFNQNINGLSWGAANLAWKSVQMYQQYLAIGLITAVQAVDLRAKQVLGHYDGRQLLGKSNQRIYSTVCSLLDAKPNQDQPFLFDDSDRWLEQDIEKLANDLGSQGSLIKDASPILKSFDTFCEEQA